MPLLAELSQCSLRCFLAVDFSKKYGKIIHGGGDSYADGEEPPFPAPKFNSEALKKEVMFWQVAEIAKRSIMPPKVYHILCMKRQWLGWSGKLSGCGLPSLR